MEYKQVHHLTKSQFANLVAAIEFFFQQFKPLTWAHHMIWGWNVEHIPKHTVPMLSGPSALLATHFASLGAARLGAGIVVQQSKGLRPSELLGIEREDVMLPEQASTSTYNAAVITLGARTGTKAKRAQAVIFPVDRFPEVVEILRRLVWATRPGERLFPYTLEQYNRMIKKVTKSLDLDSIGWTAHSPRAGFASERKAQGAEFVEIREEGRWVADTSLRIYIDVVSASRVHMVLAEKGLKPALAYATAHLLLYLTADSFHGPHVNEAATQKQRSFTGARQGRRV